MKILEYSRMLKFSKGKTAGSPEVNAKKAAEKKREEANEMRERRKKYSKMRLGSHFSV